ncbi:hypothetical protein [Nitrosomonas aestuarii]|nr:hypothetical protein [Nitrosomonas aestuarii]
MKLITRFELAAKSETELRGLLRESFNELARSELGSHERRNALASIENIQYELVQISPSYIAIAVLAPIKSDTPLAKVRVTRFDKGIES